MAAKKPNPFAKKGGMSDKAMDMKMGKKGMAKDIAADKKMMKAPPFGKKAKKK